MAEKRDPIVSPPRDQRLPPGQVETKAWPVLHYGTVPKFDQASWNLRAFGAVTTPMTWTWNEFARLPRVTVHSDIHCVTHWSKFDNVWEGVPMRAILDAVAPKNEAKFVVVHAEGGFTTNLPIAELERDDVLLAEKHNGETLTADHGFPLRLVVPHLYFWKSAKWLRGFEFTEHDRPGFWERNGYHMHGDPWDEERFSF